MSLVPITDRAVKAYMPVEGKEQDRAIVVVGEDIDARVHDAAKDEGQPPISTSTDFVHEAPEENGVDNEGGWRVQEVVAGDPPGIVEVQIIECTVHHP